MLTNITKKKGNKHTGSKIDVPRRRRTKHAWNLFEQKRVRSARVRKRTIPRLRVRACVQGTFDCACAVSVRTPRRNWTDRPTDRKSCEWVASPFTFNRTRWNAHTTLCCALLEVDEHVFRSIRGFLSKAWHKELSTNMKNYFKWKSTCHRSFKCDITLLNLMKQLYTYVLCKYNKNLPNLFVYVFSYLSFVYILSSKCLQFT